jgi:beta-lactamase regulating signal transducer with metallopeptidase domain
LPIKQYRYASFSLVEPSLYFTRIESPKITSPVSLLADTMAPIPIPIRLRFPETVAAPSRSKRASDSTTDPFVIIGIIVSVVCFVGFIGAACYVWRRRRWAKLRGLGEVEYSEIDTTYAGNEIKYRRVSELKDTSTVAPIYTTTSTLSA